MISRNVVSPNAETRFPQSDHVMLSALRVAEGEEYIMLGVAPGVFLQGFHLVLFLNTLHSFTSSSSTF